MRGTAIRPFSDADVDAAAELLAERHARHLRVEPLVAVDPDFRGEIEAERARDRASGAVAFRDERLAAFLVGRIQEDVHARGPAAVVDLAGHAAAEPELLRDLYASLAQSWVDEGVVRHVVYVPACDRRLLDTWFALGFGQQATYAARETTPDLPSNTVLQGIEIRAAAPADLDAAVAFDRQLFEHQERAPSFSGRPIPEDAALRAEWRGTWNDPRFAHFVATRGGRAVGHILLFSGREPSLRIPQGSVDLADAATAPDVRGSGVGLALTRHAVAWAREQGYRAMTIDWRVVNLLASRFWTQRGFRPTFLRLYRHVP